MQPLSSATPLLESQLKIHFNIDTTWLTRVPGNTNTNDYYHTHTTQPSGVFCHVAAQGQHHQVGDGASSGCAWGMSPS